MLRRSVRVHKCGNINPRLETRSRRGGSAWWPADEAGLLVGRALGERAEGPVDLLRAARLAPVEAGALERLGGEAELGHVDPAPLMALPQGAPGVTVHVGRRVDLEDHGATGFVVEQTEELRVGLLGAQ